jgi:hypothetical protein
MIVGTEPAMLRPASPKGRHLVEIKPGAMAFTVMPSLPAWRASERVKPVAAAWSRYRRRGRYSPDVENCTERAEIIARRSLRRVGRRIGQ